MKKLSLLLALVMILGLLAGCGSTAPTAQSYTLESGIVITAESGMTETAQAPFTTTLQGKNSMVTFLEESKAMLASGMTAEEYAAIVTSGNGLSGEFATDAEGNLANSYTREIDGNEFFYYITVKETGTSFWLVQMVCLADQQETYEPLFRQWLAGVQLPENENGIAVTDFTEKTFELDCGLKVTMPDDMGQLSMEGYTEFYTNNVLGFLLLEEEKPEGWTLADYTAAVAEANGLDALEADEYGNPSVTYSYEANGMVYHYYLTVHEFSDCFVLCQFFCMDEVLEVYGEHMAAWSDSLTE